MPRAILKNGLIYPLEPLPPDWGEGQELDVQEVEKDSEESLERWYQELETMVRENDAEDLGRLEAALQEADVVAKEQMRRDGLKGSR